MPELPEVETMRRGILPVEGARIRSLTALPCRLRPIQVRPAAARFRRRVTGRRIQAVGRIGKRVTLELDNQQVVVFEPRMTGLVLLRDPPDHEHLRVRIDLEQCPVKQLWFWDRRGLGSVYLLTSRQLQQRLGPDRLGPDAMQITVDQMRDRMKHSRRAIKVALLDQMAVAGIGNLYASEILHVAAVHPATRCHRLTRPLWQRIHQAMQDVLEEAIRCEGSTLSDGTYRNALNDPGSYQNHHRVYDRAGQPCPRCASGSVRRIVQAQRSTFFCPGCQKRR